MALTKCELVWLKHLLKELKFCKIGPTILICDNHAALNIGSNPIFHGRTKHIEIDCHFIYKKILPGGIMTSFVNFNNQPADIFTKSLWVPRVSCIFNELDAYDIYAQT